MAALFKHKITINVGLTYKEILTWSTGKPYVPVNFTGCTAKMQIRSSLKSEIVLAELSTANGKIVLGQTDGTILLNISSAETETYTWSHGVYDFELTYSNGDIIRLFEGSVVTSGSITR